jgi:tetratricopeptide (TPR) repeat protein
MVYKKEVRLEMKMIMKRKMFSVVMLLAAAFTGNVAFAQCKEWPAEKAKAEESLAIYGDAVKQGNYRGATASLQWLLTNAPKVSTKIYIDGADIYDKLADKETDPAKKKVLVDSMLWMFDARIKNCGDEVNVMNRKAYASYRYNVKDKDKVAELLAMYDKVYEISGNNVTDVNLVAYFNTVYGNFVMLKNLTDEQVLQRYDKIQNVIDVKIKDALAKGKTADADKLKSYKGTIDDLLIKMVKVDCDFVKKNLEPKFRQNPADVALAKKIFGFMLQGKCTDDPLWLEAGEAVNKVEQDFAIAKNLGLKYLSSGNVEKGEQLLKEAVTLAKTPAEKGDALIGLGAIEAKNGKKSAARDLFRQAAAANPSNKEAYEKIGDLYQNSFEECSKKKSMAEDRLIYIAAYEMYAKAGDAQKMANAKAQFPSTSEIFELNWKEGESKSTGCWIGETVILKTRKD